MPYAYAAMCVVGTGTPGRRIVNVDPRPGALSTSIVPPSCSTNCRTM